MPVAWGAALVPVELDEVDEVDEPDELEVEEEPVVEEPVAVASEAVVVAETWEVIVEGTVVVWPLELVVVTSSVQVDHLLSASEAMLLESETTPLAYVSAAEAIASPPDTAPVAIALPRLSAPETMSPTPSAETMPAVARIAEVMRVNFMMECVISLRSRLE